MERMTRMRVAAWEHAAAARQTVLSAACWPGARPQVSVRPEDIVSASQVVSEVLERAKGTDAKLTQTGVPGA
jgi:hypothetical protein